MTVLLTLRMLFQTATEKNVNALSASQLAETLINIQHLFAKRLSKHNINRKNINCIENMTIVIYHKIGKF